MPGDLKFRIEGAAEMDRLLKQLGPQAANRTAGPALRAAAKPIVQRAKELVPVRTGALKASITAELERSRGSDTRRVLIGFTRPTSRIAHLVEYGTVHSAAKPFMRPALDATAAEALNEMGRSLGDGIEREARKLAGISGRRGRS